MKKPIKSPGNVAIAVNLPLHAEHIEPSPIAWTRHVATMLAILIWLAILPMLLLLPVERRSVCRQTLFITLGCFLAVVLLAIHSCALRPKAIPGGGLPLLTELEHPATPGPPTKAEEHEQQDYKGVLFLFALLFGLAAILSMETGGSWVYGLLTSKETMQNCMVSDLGTLAAKDIETFSCKDGFTDLGHEMSLMTKGAVMYRMAPVYSAPDKKVPVAWAVARNEPLVASGNWSAGFRGLSGVLWHQPRDTRCANCASVQDQESFDLLQVRISRSLGLEHGKSLPALQLDDLQKPLGKARPLWVGLALYCCAMIGLVTLQVVMCCEVTSRWAQPGTGYHRYQQVMAVDVSPTAAE